MRKYILISLFFLSLLIANFHIYGNKLLNNDSTIAKKLNSIPTEIALPYDGAVDKYLIDIINSNVTANLNIFYKYESFIDSVIYAKRLPPDLKYLAFAISNMNIRYSGKYNAMGIWGLYSPIAAKYGLHITPFIDQRYDVIASTAVAINYLNDLYNKYNDWWQVILIYTNGMPAYLQATKSLYNQGLKTELWNYYYHTDLPNKELIPCYIATIYNFYYSFQKPTMNNDINGNVERINIKNPIIITDLLMVLKWNMQDFITYNPIWVGGLLLPSERYPLLLPESLSMIFYKYEDSLYLLQQRRNPKYLTDELDSVVNGDDDSLYNNNIENSENEEKIISESKVTSNITNPTPKTIIHKVQKGETLSHIAERYKVNIKNLMQWNNLTNDKIYEGQQLKIIKTSNSATNNYHIVQSGESIWSIAQKYNVSEQNIMKWNNLRNDKIYPGQKLIIYQNQQNTSISKSTFAKSNKITYIVKNGDSIWLIAKKYNVSEQNIMKWNNLKNDKIYPGQKLVILK
ncbi:MAG TPA: LysM peptidoglycan-binding domain-containing protein [Bacteroidales bacterium]|nr:LysM peptidoglycan-binding domain-containing protein [Bacteroidales bacterium]